MHSGKTSFRLLHSILLLSVMTLAACSKNDDKPTQIDNQSPTVSIDGVASVEERESVTLTAIASDSDGQIQSYQWSQVSGPDVTLGDVQGNELTFNAPDLTEDMEIAFSLTVTDNDGASSSANTTIAVSSIKSQITLTGMVVDSPLADATVTAEVGTETFTSQTDSSGVYTITLLVDESNFDRLILLTATGEPTTNPGVVLVSQLPYFSTLANQAGTDMTLSAEDLFSLNVTNVSSAEAALMIRENGNQPIVTEAELATLMMAVNTAQKIELSALIKIIVDNDGYDLPEGVTDTFALVTNMDDERAFYAFVSAQDAEIIGQVIDLIISDDDLVRSGGANEDYDQDGVVDSLDAFPFDATETIDTDSDGIGNNADTDDDGDNVADGDDAFPLDSTESVDTDMDGTGNNADTDDDGDNVADGDDAFPLDSTESVDTDMDGTGNNADTDDDGDNVADGDDAFPLDSTESVDTDMDGTGNNADTDDDGDNVADGDDAFPLDSTESVDTDMDGTGNNADTDDDGDNVADGDDAFPLDSTESVDTDMDGTGNNADTDDDGDNVADGDDAFPLDSTESSDNDMDGTGDNADLDDDNDGIEDTDDGYPNIAIGDLIDTDGDGIPDDCDSDCQALGMQADDDDNGNGIPDDEEFANLAISITTPLSLVTVGSSPITVEGTVEPVDATVIINGVEITNNNGSFSGDVALTEGANTIEARATKGAGTQTDTISVSLDKTPPFITIESHTDQQNVFTETVTITGLVNDIVRGTVEASQANVSVNGNDAQIENRSYSVQDVQLQEGENTITVSGSDQVGNTSSKVITLNYQVPVGKRILEVSGKNQSAIINNELTEPLVVRVVDASGDPLEDETVVFRVSQGSGAVGVGEENEGRAIVVDTDADGIASTIFKVGARTGTNNHKATASVVGVESQVSFNASATGEIGNKLSVNSGNNQRGAVGKVLPEAFVVVVTDNGANVVPDARVSFEATVGGGSFGEGENSIEVVTDSDGRASVEYTLGDITGIDRQRVVATLIDAPEGQTITAGFSATAFVPADPGETTVTGVVLDNQDMAIPNVTVRIEGTTREALSAADGRFEITEAPVGPIHLIADGSTATVEGEFPSLGYDLVTISGVDNPLPAPIYMVKLNTENAVMAGSEDAVLELEQFPGFKLEIAKDSVTFPDGAKEGLVSVTPVNAGTVPMAPPNGMQPQFIVTIQPTGTLFDPPAKLTLPNVDAHEAGAQVEMYSFDHDLEEFVAIGLGTVSEDGTLVESNPGVGVVKAGWHCGSQPGGQSCAHNCPVCQDCDGDCNCVPADGDPRLAGLDVIGDCKEPGCENGSQVTINDDADIPDDDVIGDCKNFNCVDGAVVVEDDPLDETKCTTCGENGPEPKPDGTVPDDDKCIICQDGKETKKPDNEIGSETYAFNGVKNFIADVNSVLEWVGSTKKIPEISLELQTAEKEVCCTQQDGATTLEETATGTVVFPVFGVSWTPTIPPWSGDYTFRVFGRSIGVAYGIRFTASFSGKVSLSRTKRECQGDNCWGGSATGDLGLSGGPFGSVPNPASSPVACGSDNEKRPCDLIRLEGTIKTGVNIQAGVNCEKITGTIGHNGVSINADVILAEGSWVEVGASASWVIVNSGSLAVIDIALPN